MHFHNLIPALKGLFPCLTGSLAFLLFLLISFPSTGSGDNFKDGFTAEFAPTGSVTLAHVPLFLDREENELITIRLNLPETAGTLSLRKITFTFTDNSTGDCISSLTVYKQGSETESAVPVRFGKAIPGHHSASVRGRLQAGPGSHIFSVKFDGNRDSDIASLFGIKSVRLDFDKGVSLRLQPGESYVFHAAKTLRAAGQDSCDTYRIPGLVTTDKGTLIAVYDNRYLSSTDLQGHIDVGMSRSTDGGNTWEPMKRIMDMGKWGGKPEAENGIGDPCVLFDPVTKTTWVAALWFHGKPGMTAWWGSGPGLEPAETGQLMLVKSTDDGITWSQPVNITAMTKNPAWYLFFQGPGRGVTLEDGTLVFPAQFKDSQQVPHSTIIYSKDHGITWTTGTGAKPHTTEAQVVQLADGSLMLNMRDDANRTEKGDNNGRAVAITKDLGNTWTRHPGSNQTLPEPNCMASLISAPVMVKGRVQEVLFFSNPNDRSSRIRMTIKASFDEGLSWPEDSQLEIFGPEGFGYSCLTLADRDHLGIVYEGKKELYYQKIPVSNILRGE